ncbi:MAG: hypothetical protein QJR03_15635 [Sphaerobacter sp.]|nr:hypothetical protein [Sphaerobacter sp.]
MSAPRGSNGQPAPPSRAFDPRPHLRQITLRGQTVEYLDVKWRLAWLRTEHPDARITTEHVTLTDELAVFRALVELPGGGAATGYGSETRDDWEDFIEKAETKAIGRALAALGYGTQFALDFDLDTSAAEEATEPLVDAPVAQPAPAAAPEQLATPARREPPRRARLQAVPPPGETAGPPLREVAEPAPTPSREPAPAPDAGRPDRNWTSFWTEVRRLGYKTKAELEQVLGHPIDTASTPPDQIWQELMAHRRRRGLEE